MERVSAEEFWKEKRARQAASHSRVVSGEIPQSALFVSGAEQLRGAEFTWPTGGVSPLADDDDVEDVRRPLSSDEVRQIWPIRRLHYLMFFLQYFCKWLMMYI